MTGNSFTRLEKLFLHWIDLRERIGFAALKFRYSNRVNFGLGSKVSAQVFRFSGLGRLDIGAGVQVDPGYHPVSFDVGPGARVKIGEGTWIQSQTGSTRFAAAEGAVIEVGRRCWFSGGHLGATEKITVGEGTLIGWGCLIVDSTLHDVDNNTPQRTAPISIGSYVWLPNYVTVFPGVTIGDHCVIGAGSLVTKDIPPNSFAAGRPATVIRSIANRNRAK